MTDILENTSDGFFAVDQDWKFTLVNRQAEKLLDRRRQDLIGKDFWMEFPEFTRNASEDNYRRAMSEQVAVEFEASHRSGQVWFELLAYPRCGGVSVFLRDVTDRKRVEQERLTTSKLDSPGTLALGPVSGRRGRTKRRAAFESIADVLQRRCAPETGRIYIRSGYTGDRIFASWV
jgi:PAS domain S-box-containing protein